MSDAAIREYNVDKRLRAVFDGLHDGDDCEHNCLGSLEAIKELIGQVADEAAEQMALRGQKNLMIAIEQLSK